jgi:hypothetical protein
MTARMREHRRPIPSDPPESPKERREREHGELLEELRSLIPGAEVLFGFLLAIRFTEEFHQLASIERNVYYATLMATSISLVLLLAPSVFHRLRFREDDKEAMLRKGNREAIAGSIAIGLSLTGVVFLVTSLVFDRLLGLGVAVAFFLFIAWRWWAIALARKARDGRLPAPSTRAELVP